MADVPDVSLEIDIYNHEPGHASKHNSANAQINALTQAWNARGTDPVLSGQGRPIPWSTDTKVNRVHINEALAAGDKPMFEGGRRYITDFPVKGRNQGIISFGRYGSSDSDPVLANERIVVPGDGYLSFAAQCVIAGFMHPDDLVHPDVVVDDCDIAADGAMILKRNTQLVDLAVGEWFLYKGVPFAGQKEIFGHILQVVALEGASQEFIRINKPVIRSTAAESAIVTKIEGRTVNLGLDVDMEPYEVETGIVAGFYSSGVRFSSEDFSWIGRNAVGQADIDAFIENSAVLVFGNCLTDGRWRVRGNYRDELVEITDGGRRNKLDVEGTWIGDTHPRDFEIDDPILTPGDDAEIVNIKAYDVGSNRTAPWVNLTTCEGVRASGPIEIIGDAYERADLAEHAVKLATGAFRNDHILATVKFTALGGPDNLPCDAVLARHKDCDGFKIEEFLVETPFDLTDRAYTFSVEEGAKNGQVGKIKHAQARYKFGETLTLNGDTNVTSGFNPALTYYVSEVQTSRIFRLTDTIDGDGVPGASLPGVFTNRSTLTPFPTTPHNLVLGQKVRDVVLDGAGHFTATHEPRGGTRSDMNFLDAEKRTINDGRSVGSAGAVSQSSNDQGQTLSLTNAALQTYEVSAKKSWGLGDASAVRLYASSGPISVAGVDGATVQDPHRLLPAPVGSTLYVMRVSETVYRVDGTPTILDSSGHVITSLLRQQQQQEIALRPTGALAETAARVRGSANVAGPTLGAVYWSPIFLLKGTVVTNISFLSGTTAASAVTHLWFGLYDTVKDKVLITNDDIGGAWSANSYKTLALTGGPYVVPADGLYYLAMMITGTTAPSLTCVSMASSIAGSLQPYLSQGTTATTYTDPASAPASLVGLGATRQLSGYPLAYVS